MGVGGKALTLENTAKCMQGTGEHHIHTLYTYPNKEFPAQTISHDRRILQYSLASQLWHSINYMNIQRVLVERGYPCPSHIFQASKTLWIGSQVKHGGVTCSPAPGTGPTQSSAVEKEPSSLFIIHVPFTRDWSPSSLKRDFPLRHWSFSYPPAWDGSSYLEFKKGWVRFWWVFACVVRDLTFENLDIPFLLEGSFNSFYRIWVSNMSSLILSQVVSVN